MTRKEISSFKDPGGHIFYDDRDIYRQINRCYRDDYNKLLESGLYDRLNDENLIIGHRETDREGGFKVIKPEEIDFISYPYEWSFSQLKDAALLTLKIQKIALRHGMILKDASSYNIQFKNGEPVFIDTLSFKIFEEDLWQGYEQFCKEFLAPLALMQYRNTEIPQMMKSFPEGIPTDLVSEILPLRTVFKPRIALHIHLLSRLQEKIPEAESGYNRSISKTSLIKFVESLEKTVKGLKSPNKDSLELSSDYKRSKEKFLTKNIPRFEEHRTVIFSSSSNCIGFFERIIDKSFILFFDTLTETEAAYKIIKEKNPDNIDVFLQDIRSPSPGIGWANKEMKALEDRNIPESAIVLNLDKLVLEDNIRLDMVAEYLSQMFDSLIIEFMPEKYSNYSRSGSEKHVEYSLDRYEQVFNQYFSIEDEEKTEEDRKLYFMTNK